MKVNIKTRNVDITPALKEYLEKKLSKFDKYLNKEGEAAVSLSVIKELKKVEVTINIYGNILRAEEEDYDIFTCIDNVEKKLDSRIQRYKSRLTRKDRTPTKELFSDNTKYNEVLNEFPVRTKKFPIKPISVEEAIMQMNLLGHSFFVFLNMENEQVNVVYKRKNETYGLLEPQ